MAHGHGSISVCHTSDGTSASEVGNLLLYYKHDQVQPNVSTICVLDNLTFTRHNSDVADETVVVKVSAGSIPIWVGALTVAPGEVATLDKEFVDGLPIWTGTAASNSTAADPKYSFSSVGQPYKSSSVASTAYAGGIQVYINGAAWVGDAAGMDALSARYHFEPSNLRRS